MIGVHGRLKSTNCVIDSRWTCKITDIGLFKFKDGQDENEEVGIDHEFNSKSLKKEGKIFTDFKLIWAG